MTQHLRLFILELEDILHLHIPEDMKLNPGLKLRDPWALWSGEYLEEIAVE